MGQFASSAFNGDPYIDIIRALPDKEIVWWIQKGIWLAQGFTLVEHFGRTYHQIFIHKCDQCNGAGILTCPHCDGYKMVRAHKDGHRLSDHTPMGRLMATADSKECDHCGDFGPWDAESEWQEKWVDWEKKLAYYDRTYGALFDELKDDMENSGNVDLDTPQMEDEIFSEVEGIHPEIDRRVSNMGKQMKALMTRFDGHPYDNNDMMSGKIIDITKTMNENLENIAINRADYPPELHPEAFPEYLLMANSPIEAFNNQIRGEYLIMKNLDAAIRDAPKPCTFEATAGTVPCPKCDSQPYSYSFNPNWKMLFKTEQPFWMRTLANMRQLDTWDKAMPVAPGTSMGSVSAPVGSSALSSASGSGREYGEVPRERYKDEEIEEAMKGVAPGLLKFTPGQGSSAFPLRGSNIWGKDNSWLLPGTSDVLPVGFRRSVSAEARAEPVASQDLDSDDPLNTKPPTMSNKPEDISRVGRSYNPLTGTNSTDAQWMYSNMNPAKNLARKIRDLRALDAVQNTEEEEVAMYWLKTRDSLAPEFHGQVPLPRAKAQAK